jgi:twitching motility protein PilT
MASIIVGVGHQNSLRKALQIAEGELQRSQGNPRRLVLRAAGMELIAARHQFEGEFESFILRLKADSRTLETLIQLATHSATTCSVSEFEGGKEFHCDPGASAGDAAMRLLDQLSALIHLPEIWRVHGEDFRHVQLSVESLFRLMVGKHASDVHLFPGSPPLLRVDNLIQPAEAGEALSAEQILSLIRDTSHEHDWKEFQTQLQCSFNYHQVGLGYSRISAFIKAGVPHCTIRFLPEKIPSFEDLHVPRSTMEALARLDYGLILVTGMTGSGKSTTVASFLDWVNEHNHVHVVTIEEPVEYVHINRKAIISQRDVGVDVPTFADAVRGALRHDPDVIFIGEMRDQDTIRAAINAAATGHLVISTLHSNTSAEVVNRIVSFFDPVERDLVKLQLRDAIKCVMCQRLLPKVGGGRVPAIEFLFNDTKHINDCILAGDTVGIREGMQQTASQSSIFEDSLLNLFRSELISLETARHHASTPEILEQMRLGTYHPPTLESHV